MKYYRSLPMMVSILLVICQNAIAMDEDFGKQLENEFFGFEIINHKILEQAINNVPEQKNLWGCGLHQCGHALQCAHAQLKSDDFNAINYNEPGDYPLSVNANLSLFGNMVSNFGIKTDNKGNFRVGATPHELANFLNKRKADNSPYTAQAYSRDTLTVTELMEQVKSSVKNNMPTLAYYVVNPQAQLMHVYAIVGYVDNAEESELILLDTVGIGIKRLKKISAAEFINNMNAQSIIKMVNDLDTSLGAFLRPMIIGNGGRVAPTNMLKLWKPFSLVTWVAEEKQLTECTQQ
jgi:hypothetical protein